MCQTNPAFLAFTYGSIRQDGGLILPWNCPRLMAVLAEAYAVLSCLWSTVECECQTGECPNTSVILVTPSWPHPWARLESCQHLFSGLLLGRPCRFNTPDTLAPLHRHVYSVGRSFPPLGCLNDNAGYLLTNDGPHTGPRRSARLDCHRSIVAVTFTSYTMHAWEYNTLPLNG